MLMFRVKHKLSIEKDKKIYYIISGATIILESSQGRKTAALTITYCVRHF